MIRDFSDEYLRYRIIAEKAMEQVSEEKLNAIPAPEANSIAMLVRHLSGNLVSRFTDFLTSDGEKPWRDRDAEFVTQSYSRNEMMRMWADGWDVLDSALAQLTDEDLGQTVIVRGQGLTVHEALCRSLAHLASHVGQIVLLARMLASEEWKWISIPKNQSQTYNLNPTLEKKPTGN